MLKNFKNNFIRQSNTASRNQNKYSVSEVSSQQSFSLASQEVNNLNPLKEIQTQIAQTRRQKIVANRRKNFQDKKKTELCKNYVLGEPCPLGDRCSFAHGEEELKPKPFNHYKTVKCRHYHERGFCQYGPRCQFLHNDRKGEVREVKLEYSQLLRIMNDKYLLKAKDCGAWDNHYFDENVIDIPMSSRGKLPIFQNLRGGDDTENEWSQYTTTTDSPTSLSITDTDNSI